MADSPVQIDYTRQPIAPSEKSRPLRVWIILLLVWGIGLLVWAAYACGAIYFFFKLFSAEPGR